MKIQKQCISLDLAKRLKALGVKQKSVFCWHSKIDDDGNSVYTDLDYFPVKNMPQDYSAFTASELGEILPTKIYGDQKNWQWKTDGDFNVAYGEEDEWLKVCTADTEAEARGKMLVYLLEEGIVKVEEI